MEYVWNEEKNQLLKKEPSISFERICIAIENGNILDIRENLANPEYIHLRIMIIEIDNYTWVVPFYDDHQNQSRVLITAFPSRKFQQLYKGQKP